MKVYLAGPMKGKPKFNFPAFTKAAFELRKEGHDVFSPHEADLDRYGTITRMTEAHDKDRQAFLRVCLKEDLDWIADHAEAIALLPGWENSKGVAAELALANALGLEVIKLDG